MELILKTTGRCNFACDFCMAGKADIMHMENSVPDEICRMLRILKPDCVIANGGEPLLSGVEFFEDLLGQFEGSLAIVSNLRLFYEQPDRWISLFRNPRVSVTTSFQYGSGRRIDSSTVYDERMFRAVMDKFHDLAGYKPMFISVITPENAGCALDHVMLAKDIGTVCKLNPLMPMGRSSSFFPLYKMVDIWLSVKRLGLEKYTDAHVQFYDGGCAFNTCMMCDSTIRVMYLDTSGKLKYGHCESLAMAGIFADVDTERPVQKCAKLDPRLLLTGECVQCRLCRLCNACSMSRETNRLDPNHCAEMRKRMPEILDSGWFV